MPFDVNDPKTFALMQLASGLMAGGAPSYGPPKNFLGVLGGAGPGALHSFMVAKQQQEMDEYRKLVNAGLRRDLNAPPSPIKMGPDEILFDPATKQPMFRNPATPKPTLVEAPVPGQAGVTQPTWVIPGQATGTAVGGQRMPDILNPDVQAAKANVAAAGGTKVDVRVPVKLGESLAGKVGNIAESGQLAASGAVNVLDTANRVEKAIAGGNVNVGPGATIRTATDQVAQFLGAGGATVEERLVNTRNVIRGLAQFAVGARKQLKGQGQVSDYEGKLIQKADAGEIDNFTIPELKDFVSVSKKLAKQVHSEHKRIITKMRGSKDAEISDLADYFDVPDLPTEEPAAQAQPRVRKYNPQTGKIE